MKTIAKPLCRAIALLVLTTAPAPGADDAGTFRLADGVPMSYVDRGQGEPALVFIHCGNCRKEVWSETLAAFSPRHRVVAMDLPGHGASGAGRERFTIPGYGSDVAALVDHLRLARVILIGNSLGGPVALEAAARLGPQRVLGIVAVDTLQNVESEWPEEHWRNLLASYRKDFAKTCGEFMLSLLPKDSPPAARSRIEAETCKNDARAAISLLETLRAYDQKAALRAAGVPVRAINSTTFPTAVDANRKYAASFEVILMEGVGHYPQVERPDEFQRHLGRLVKELAGGS